MTTIKKLDRAQKAWAILFNTMMELDSDSDTAKNDAGALLRHLLVRVANSGIFEILNYYDDAARERIADEMSKLMEK